MSVVFDECVPLTYSAHWGYSGGVSRSRSVPATRSAPLGSRTTAIASAADRKITGTAVIHGGRMIAKATAARHLTVVVRSLVMALGSLTGRGMYTLS